MSATRMTNLPAATRAGWSAPDDPRLALVLSLADDELMVGHRHSHWTGVAPTLEEDLAFSSLAQDEIGHAAIWYSVAEELTGQDEDTLAFGRRPREYLHANLLEAEPGDWAFTIARQHAYDLYDQVRLEALTESSDASINGVLAPMLREERLHRAHARAWLSRVAQGPGDGREKVLEGARLVLAQVGGLFEALPGEEALVADGTLPLSSPDMFRPWRERLASDYEAFGMAEVLESIDRDGALGGRRGQHTGVFEPMWTEMTQMFRDHPGGELVMATAQMADVVTAVRAAVEAVEDPEMPPMTIGQLGMVVSVEVDDRAVRVQVMPTFSGCPATAYIGADVEAAVLAVDGVEAVDVVWRRDLSWGPERITERGRQVLTEVGIAPPGSGQTLLSIGGVRCPYCGSRNTRADSPFGAAPCRSTHSCRDCKTPFDAIKDF